MTLLLDWSAKRSGASITVRGVDQETRQPKIITNVEEVCHLPAGTVAICKDGTSVKLF